MKPRLEWTPVFSHKYLLVNFISVYYFHFYVEFIVLDSYDDVSMIDTYFLTFGISIDSIKIDGGLLHQSYVT